jgi:hypothetical protein
MIDAAEDRDQLRPELWHLAERHSSCLVLVDRLGSVGSVAEQPEQRSKDVEGERVRRLRLRADGQRPLAVNLEETILLTRKLFELRDAAQRAR